ncbi:siderophore-interacting protein, partial [Micromonospora sp. CPCC 206061]
AGLAMLEPLLDDPAMQRHHRLYAVRGHLLDLNGDADSAKQQYRIAARLTASLPEQRYLNRKLTS